MPTSADIRKLALALDGTSEIDHFARPAFRTTKRIFAVIRPDGLWLNLPYERKEFLLEADPAVFVKYMWGKTVNVIVQPERISHDELAALLREAWEFSQPPPPKAKTKPEPKPKAKAKAKAKAARLPEAKAKPARLSKATAKPAPKPEAKAKPQRQPEARARPQPKPKARATPAPKPEAKAKPQRPI